jgi:hypothetical protein
MKKNIEVKIPRNFNGGIVSSVYDGDIEYIQDNAYLRMMIRPILEYVLERLGNPDKYEKVYIRRPYECDGLFLRVRTIEECPVFVPDFIKEYKIEHN